MSYPGQYPLHLTTYTVAPGSATKTDKTRADFAGDGVNDQVACLAAIMAAGANNAKVVWLPGSYVFGATLTIPHRDHFVIEARGTQITCPTGSANGIVFQGGVGNTFNFGAFLSNSAGVALLLSPAGTSGNGIAESTFTWEDMVGTAQTGTGLGMVNGAGTNGVGTNYFYGGTITGYNKGVSVVATGGTTNIDTNVFNINYIYACNVCVYENGSGGSNVNAQTWNINIDASWSAGAIGFQTNGPFDLVNATIGPAVGTNIQLDSGAADVTLAMTPRTLAATAGSVVDNSGNRTNGVSVAMLLSLLAGGGKGKVAVWDSSTPGLLDFVQPPGQLQFTAIGVNFNSANSDNAIAIALPAGFTRFRFIEGTISNASHTLVTATCGVFTAAAAGGVALVASATPVTVSATADATLNNAQLLAVTGAASGTSFAAAGLATPNTIYFRVQTAEGAAATGDVTILIRPLI
jgi:hypothetical protein